MKILSNQPSRSESGHAAEPGPQTREAADAGSPSAWRVVASYLVFAVIWIYGSDRALALLFENPADITRWSVYKGFAFVAFTAILLLILVSRAFRAIELGHAATRVKDLALRASEAQLAEMINTAMDAIVAVDSERRIVRFNPAAEQMFGCGAAVAAGKPITDFISDFRPGSAGTGLILRARRADGSELPVEASISPSAGTQGTSFAMFLRDISERQARESEIDRLRRLHVARSAVSQAIVHAETRQELFERICRELVEKGGIRMAWVGWSRLDATPLQPVASWGDHHGVLAGPLVDVPLESGWAGEDCLYVCNDLLADAATQATHEAVINGEIRARAVFPIQSKGKVIGALSVYAGEVGYFQEQEIGLLAAAASDVSFALDALAQEDRLNRERARLVEAQQIAGLGSWDTDLCTGDVVWSEQTYRIFGVDPAHFVPTHERFLELVHPDDRDFVDAEFRRSLQHAQTGVVEHRLLLRGGQVKYVEERWQVTTDDAGRPTRALGTCHDITARRRAEAAQREQAVLLENAERIGQMGSWSFDIDGGRLLWSEPTCALFGIAPQDFQGTLAHFYQFVLAEDRQILQAASAAACPAQPMINVEYRIRRPDGTLRWMYERGVVEFDAGRPVRHLGMVMDVTERRADKLALQQSLDELGRRNRELQEFAYVASHDLQEPLRKIRTFSELLVTRHRQDLEESARDYLDRITRAATRMQTLIQDLLEYSRIATGGRPTTPVDLMKICREVLADLDARIESTQARIHVGELPTIVADAVQMRQLFQNLVGNALKFCSPQRTPEISISCQPAVLGDEAALQIEIADNGIGFEPRFAEKIFNPFQRLHARSEHEGTGMGLAIVRRVVERHGGTVCAIGTPNVGTRVLVLLPRPADGARQAVQ
jgi:PAS domain S-box-containing protein